MAGNKVKRGFFFYLGIFLLFILGFIGVCITIMIINPGKNVLGFSYYSYNKGIMIEKTTDEAKNAIDLDNTTFETITIDAGNVDVVVQNNDDYKKSGIYLINSSSGFVKSEDNVSLEYSVLVDGSNLNIKANTTRGFISFSDDVKLLIHYGKISENKLENTKLKIKTTSGSVNLGGSFNAGHTADIYPDSIDIETDSGNVKFGRHASNIYSQLSIRTNSGNIDLTSVEDKINTVENKDNSLQVTSGKINVISNSGIIDLNKAKSDVYIASDSGTVRAKEINGNVDVKAYSCIIEIDKITGNLNFSEGSEIMSACKVYVNELSGDLNVPQGRNSYIEVLKIGGNVNIHNTNGNVNLGSDKSPLSKTVYVETTMGNINVKLESNRSRFFVTEKGNISLTYANGIYGSTNISNNSGNTEIIFEQNSKVKFDFKLKRETEEEFDLSKVSFDIFNGNKLPSNPYYFNSSVGAINGTVEIITDSSVVLDLA